jgi:potassium-transporting ATPase KdpC subunit
MLQVARRQIIPAIVLTVVFAVFFGLVFPAVVTGIGRVVFPDRANGSLVKVNGKVVGSALIGQEFLDSKGNPDPHYFQSRPSNAGAGYDPTASGASNLGPGDARLVGNVPGLNIVGKNPYATPSDPWCLPVPATDKNGNDETDKAGNPIYEKNPDGTYVCNANTVPERALAYRSLNHLSAKVMIPVDAVTSSASGLDPDISPANAMLQAPRVAAARGLPVATVLGLVKSHTNDRQWGFLGDETVNVLDLNLALNRLGS